MFRGSYPPFFRKNSRAYPQKKPELSTRNALFRQNIHTAALVFPDSFNSFPAFIHRYTPVIHRFRALIHSYRFWRESVRSLELWYT